MQEAKKGRRHGVIAETGETGRGSCKNAVKSAKKGRKRCAIAEKSGKWIGLSPSKRGQIRFGREESAVQ